ncbi:MAG: flavin reductase family protein, partial [Microvirga sp.]
MADALGFDFAELPQRQRYKLLVGLVVPRPIALVTTLGPGGVVNAAPFSFFNVFSEEPPLVVLGLQSHPDGALKDTAANIREIGSFVVNLVDEGLAERMNI